MKLERLVLDNFRQFKGRQEIIFSDIDSRNVTIVHAENGFGKTTLLKALLWVLYGRDGLMGPDGKPDDFQKPDHIIPEGLEHSIKDPNAAIASVELSFKHDAVRYILTRKLSLAQQRLDPNKTDVSLAVVKDGQTFNSDNPQKRIQAIVPNGISGLLFFNGERISYLAMEKNRTQITEAIHQMLGLKLLKTTIEDLKHPNVRGKLRNEQKENSSVEKRELIEQSSALELKCQEFEESRRQVHANIKAISSDLSMIDNKLAANREAMDLQKRRIHLTAERDELSAKLDELTRRLSKLISERGYTLFSANLISRGRAVRNQLSAEGKIPARVLNSFLQELLDSCNCICKRSLEEKTSERAAVENLLTIAGDQDFNNAVSALDNAIGVIEEASRQSQDEVRLINSERLEIIRDIRNKDEELEDIHQALGGKKDEEVQQLEEKRKGLQLDRDAQNAAIGRLDGQIESAKDEIESLVQRIRQLADKEEAAARAQRRVDAAEDCAKLLEDILEAETNDLRPLLNKEIDEHFRKIIDRDYWAELTEDYTLRILKHIHGGELGAQPEKTDVALSNGQMTVTSLVFIASLVALAKRRSEIPTILRGLSGSEYPVAIDSPFGSLSMFRRGVALYIPELAPQVLLLVSPEQYNGQVELALNESGRVGKRYYLVYHGRTMPDRANPELIVNGEKIQQYYHSETEEYTEIKAL